MAALVGEEGLKFAQKVWKVMSGGSGYEKSLRQVKIISAGNGGCTAEFVVEKDLTNQLETLHGGCTSTLVDVISTVGLMTMGPRKPGVSVNLNVNFQSAAKVGNELEVDSKTLKYGRTLAYCEVTVKEKGSGKIIATGSHVKHIG